MRLFDARHRFRSALALAGLAVVTMGAASRRAVAAEVLPGVEVLVGEFADDLAGKRVGIMTNPTGVDRRLRSTIDLIRALPRVKVVRLFAPEHGIRGGFYAGDHVDESRDPVSGLPIASLYGRTRRPTPEMLRDLDVVIYDIQDVGHRSYTFVSSLTYMMEECEKAGVAVWVLDRPEPMGGRLVGGPMLEPEVRSFIGVHPVPQVYGMTPGEWASMIKAERTPNVQLRVIKMRGWKRGMTYGDLGWIWIPPSQHIPRWETCYFYAMTGTIGELGRLSEGVGTPLPFELMGAPWLDGVRFANTLNAAGLRGVLFRPVTFSPRYGTHQGKTCQGVQIHLTDYRTVQPTRVAAELMKALVQMAPDQRIFRTKQGRRGQASMFVKALGDRRLAQSLAENRSPADHMARIDAEIENFMQRRRRYLLYD